ncbi:MAG: FMN-binding glutamate synthase family protein, partial [Myxococcota bacterium]|nr:FMN-binding glutamate synthase family protein [Myxococcota bacterium]
ERRWVYSTSKGQNSNFGFGTTELLYAIGYPIIKHATFPYRPDGIPHPGGDASWAPSLKVMGAARGRKRPYRPQSIVNISAMSFGSLGANAIMSLNRGARDAGAFHNTGEGGVSPYHLQGGDLVWQLGTGYFGAREENGAFCLSHLVNTVQAHPEVRAIEIKLSQGAKPGKGGILPSAKITAEISRIREIPMGRDCISPAYHTAFSDVDSLIDFVEMVADGSGLPVGIKSAIGQMTFWNELARRMAERKEGPDFISVDGGEGGTGAAPLTFSDHVALPFKVGFSRIYPVFQEAGVSEEIVWIGSGKLGFPDRAILAFTLGCDLIQVAREAMLSVGCIQALKCHTGECPAGVATQSRWLQRGLDVDNKSQRATRYLRGFRKELLQVAQASGHAHPLLFRGSDIEFSTGVNSFTSLDEVLGYKRDPVTFTRWEDYGPLEGD